MTGHHIVFCSDDAALLESLIRFVSAALHQGNPVVVWATESHRASILGRVRAQAIDIDGAIQRGTYIASDVGEAPDPELIVRTLEQLRMAAFEAGVEQPRLAVCGERAGLLWEQGSNNDALQIEELFNALSRTYEMDILCVYPLAHCDDRTESFARLCEEHSSFSFRWSSQ
jgi:hypothetical protein